MILTKDFLDFNKKLKKKHSTKKYNSLLNKSPFIEVENDTKLSPIHNLIEEGYLEIISLDIGNQYSLKYTIHLSDKAIDRLQENISI